MNIYQVLALAALSATIVTSQECALNAVNPISEEEGMIDTGSLWRGAHCNHTWKFISLPNKEKMLLINITIVPLRLDVIKLYDENFIDSEDPDYKCMILNAKPTDASQLNDMMSQVVILHKIYPGCKVQYGLSPPVHLSYIPSISSPLLTQNFEIKYKAIALNEVPTPTEEPRIVKSITSIYNTVSKTSTTPMPFSPTEKHSKDEQMTIVLIVLAGIAVLLLAVLIIALLIRRNRLKRSASKPDLPLDDQYQTVPEVSPGSTVVTNEVLYNEIYPNNRPGCRINGSNSRQDVLNPLYDSRAKGGKHAYEYIEIKLTPQREERSQL